jgi:50S ribosomal protein L24
MAIIVKKGQLEKLNENISEKRLAKRKTYTVKEYPFSNLSNEAKEALDKIFEKIDNEKGK